MDTEICKKQNKYESIKQILMPKSNMSIQNPKWQEKSWEIRKLANILQWHKDDPNCHNGLGEEVLPERCRFRKINEQICIASIGQLKARNIKLSTEEYEQLVLHVKKNFSKTINDNMINISFKNLDVEDRVLSCLRASSSGDKLRRIINIKREDSTNTIYKRIGKQFRGVSNVNSKW